MDIYPANGHGEKPRIAKGTTVRTKFFATTSFQTMIHVRSYLIVSLILTLTTLAIFYWFSQLVSSSTQYWQVQVDSFIYLNSQLSTHTTFWHNLTQLCDAYILLPLLSFFIFLKPQIWAAFWGAVPLATLLTHGVKAWASVPRPAAVLDQSTFNIIGEKLSASNSLPSGHTATIFVTGTVIALVYFSVVNNKWRWSILTLALATATIFAISRIAVGAHWPLDVFFGAICGILGGLSGIALTRKYTRWWRWMEQPKYWLIMGIIMLTWSISLLPPLYENANSLLVAKTAAALVGLTCSCQLIIRHFSKK